MRTVNEVSKLTGVSIRTLHYYDSIGLLRPARTTEAGYRLYDDAALEKLQSILLLRELQFPLKEIKKLLDNPAFDRNKALGQQIELLELRREHIENLIHLAREIQQTGVKQLDFSAFDTTKIDEYVAHAKAMWGKTDAYKEFEKKSEGRNPETQAKLTASLMNIFADFGKIRTTAPNSVEAQALTEKLRQFITEHFYACTPEIFESLAGMYASDESMTETIDKAGGSGTAAFAASAIRHYCQSLANV